MCFAQHLLLYFLSSLSWFHHTHNTTRVKIICLILSFLGWTKLVNRNMKLHNVSHKRSLSLSMSAVSCIPFIFMTIDLVRGLKSCSRIGIPSTLPSTYAFYSFKWEKFVKIALQVLVFLTSRDRALFCPGFLSVIYLLCIPHDEKITPL